ncbi:MAG: hypothetical protein EOM50_03095 [Erysipelotrichia bacterium]|nr:hypothetical protein [Erysipelotrichia bacterium]NCC54269.1 hypothetical protein [Erysipelotrichia bacterium]
MSSKVKLTPKDCLYIDDALSQLCAIKQRVSTEKESIQDDEILTLMENVESTFATQYEEMKTLLKEACQ